MFIITLFNNAFAQSVKIRYINGIFDTDKSAERGLNSIKENYLKYKNELKLPDIMDFNYYYNPSEFSGGDLVEVVVQTEISGTANEIADMNYKIILAKAKKQEISFTDADKSKIYSILREKAINEAYSSYLLSSKSSNLDISSVITSMLNNIRDDLKDGSSLVIVAYSQGNYFSQAIYTQLSNEEKSRIRFVNVAPLSVDAIQNNKYILLKTDYAINLAYKYLPIAPHKAELPSATDVGYYTGVEGVETYWDGIHGLFTPDVFSPCYARMPNCAYGDGHDFDLVYMNNNVVDSESSLVPIPKKIISLIGESIYELAPTFVVFISSNPSSAKVGDVVNFSPKVDSKNIILYQWSFGDGASISISEPEDMQHIYEKAGTYTVQLSVTDNFGKIHLANTTITISSQDLPKPIPSFSIDFSRTALDSAGATIQGVDFITGNNGRPAAKFDGLGVSTDVIYIPNKPEITFDTNEATFDIWLRLESDKGMDGYGVIPSNIWAMSIIAKSHDRLGFAWLMDSTDSNYSGSGYGYHHLASFQSSFHCNDPKLVSRNPRIALNEWFRATVTVSPSEGTKFYTNKNLTVYCPDMKPDFSVANAEPLYLGRYSDYWYPFIGAMQDLRIYKKALTEAEVQALP